MASSGAVQVKLELGHRAQVRKKPTVEGFTHDWMVFVRGPEHSNIQHFVEKVVFHLHESFPRPKRVCKDPPYKVEESGYAGFILPIEVYFRNKEEPKKVRFDYDLFLHLEGHPPVNHLRCEKLTFNNPTEEFRRKLLKAGGQRDPHRRSSEDTKVMVMQEGSTSLFGQHLKLPTLPSSSLTLNFSDGKKNKSFPGSKDGSRSASALTITTNSMGSAASLKLNKTSKEHKDKPSKDSKESKSAFRDFGRDSGKVSKDSSKKPKENQPLRDEQPIPKLGFKEPKAMAKEQRLNEGSFSGLGQAKRRPAPDDVGHANKKRKGSFSEPPQKMQAYSGLAQPHHSEKKAVKDKSQVRHVNLRDGELAESRKVSTLRHFQDAQDLNDSDMDDNISTKSDSEQPSPASSTSSSSSGFGPQHKRQVLGPLQTVIPDLQTDDNEEESEEEEDNDVDSDLERPLHTHLMHRHRRVSLSDGSDSENSSASSPLPHNEPPPLLKASSNQILEVKSPIKQSKVDKNKNIDCDKAYLDELVELHRRLMALRERHILQQIVNLIEETGHFHITNTTFDFDLCSLDKTTVRKLQSYLETSGAS
ncbi:protein AF-9 isoform X2 [Brachyhypopomus gauderio]|uniref:protein AF-9 isoform X2 n=1 Tax=Brachyhypopomus gauderio TaxID=698409 RepID=UPI0040430739